MPSSKLIFGALASAALLTALPVAAAAQAMMQTTTTASAPVANPSPATTNNNPRENADPGYMGGLGGSSFRDVDARIAAAERTMGPKKLRAIKAEAAMRRARHGGELRDWDRELLNKKLDALGAG